MEKASGGNPATRFGFDFSWADEVEREEREQQEEQIAVQQRWEVKRDQTKADPFGAARPREVVLAEKGVDWRARDREFDALDPRGPRCAVAAASAARASNRARIVPAPACDRSTPERRAPWDAGLAGRTPCSRRQAAESTPVTHDAPPVCRSAWGGGKRKCAGLVPAPATARRVRTVGDQGRRVFGELNVGEGCGSSFRSAAKKSCNSGGTKTEGSKASEAAVADGGGSRGCCATATTATTTEDESAVGQKRKGRKRGRRGGSKKTENQQTLLR